MLKGSAKRPAVRLKPCHMPHAAHTAWPDAHVSQLHNLSRISMKWMSDSLVQRAALHQSRIVSACFLRAASRSLALSLFFSLCLSLSLLVIKHIIGFIPVERHLRATSTHENFLLISKRERERERGDIFRSRRKDLWCLALIALRLSTAAAPATQQADKVYARYGSMQTLFQRSSAEKYWGNVEKQYANRIN